MSNDLFEFKEEKFKEKEFKDLTLKELIHGPYVIRTHCDGFLPVYYVGDDSPTIESLKEKGKIQKPMSGFVDMCLHMLCEAGDESEKDVATLTYGEVKLAIEQYHRSCPQPLTFVDKLN